MENLTIKPDQKPSLYGGSLSSCSWRVRAALMYKNVDFENRLPDKTNQPAGDGKTAFQQINPLNQVPALIIDGVVLTQSVAITEYLEETRPEPPLLPKNPVERALVRQVVEIVNSGIQPLMSPATAGKSSNDPAAQKIWQVYWIEKGLTALEHILTGTRGKCCFGDTITMADVFFVPQMFSSRRFGADLTKFPVCLELFEKLLTNDVFVKSHPDHFK